MTEIDIIGGVYKERCAFPFWEEIYGSGGRAAVGLSQYFEQVKLHSILPTNVQRIANPIFESFGIETKWHSGNQFIDFDYLHCLSVPKISPPINQIVIQESFHVDADLAILFGMMECNPSVKCKTCIYDPQSPLSPKNFSETGSVADRLAIVANTTEIRKLTGKSVEEGAMHLIKTEGAEVVVVKRGPNGASVFDKSGKVGTVPSFKTKFVFTIGSGDVFVAAFSLAWGSSGMSPLDAALYASKSAAEYIETSTLPILSPKDKKERIAVTPAQGEVYLAGPFREIGQRATINEARQILQGLGLKVFSPVHDIGHGPAEKVVKLDLEALDRCDCVLAILKGSSPGTVFEVGYATAKGKPVFCVAQNMRENDLKLPKGAGAQIDKDFVTAMHLLAWR